MSKFMLPVRIELDEINSNCKGAYFLINEVDAEQIENWKNPYRAKLKELRKTDKKADLSSMDEDAEKAICQFIAKVFIEGKLPIDRKGTLGVVTAEDLEKGKVPLRVIQHVTKYVVLGEVPKKAEGKSPNSSARVGRTIPESPKK